MPRASDAKLGELHSLVADSMLAKLKSGEPVTAADWNAMSTFLKNNGIEATVAQNPALGALAKIQIPEWEDEAWDGKAN